MICLVCILGFLQITNAYTIYDCYTRLFVCQSTMDYSNIINHFDLDVNINLLILDLIQQYYRKISPKLMYTSSYDLDLRRNKDV